MKKWEYKLRKFYGLTHPEEAELNKIGSEGWELVNVIALKDGYELIFKKEITDPHASPNAESHNSNVRIDFSRVRQSQFI